MEMELNRRRGEELGQRDEAGERLKKGTGDWRRERVVRVKRRPSGAETRKEGESIDGRERETDG